MASQIESVNSQAFKEVLQTPFQVEMDGSSPLTLELIAVEEPAVPPHVEVFCLHFRGPWRPVLPQLIYRLQHDRLGSLQLFLVALSSDESGTVYEAVFNRVRKKQS
jgi:hypothetical protein